MKLLNKYKNFLAMLPRVRKYGVKYLFSIAYRHKIRNRENTARNRIKYKSFIRNRRSIKTTLFSRDGNKCFWCGNKMTFKEATIDHIIPVSVKTDNSTRNLRLIHNDCRIIRDKAIAKGILKVNT